MDGTLVYDLEWIFFWTRPRVSIRACFHPLVGSLARMSWVILLMVRWCPLIRLIHGSTHATANADDVSISRTAAAATTNDADDVCILFVVVTAAITDADERFHIGTRTHHEYIHSFRFLGFFLWNEESDVPFKPS